jgi:prepilin peptidase CpaA
MLGLSPAAAYTALFVLTLPICLWVAWSDLSRMKIPNTAVYALIAVFFFAGLAVIPLDTWLWRWASAVVVLVIGFILFAAAGWGAGDAKFAAAAAPFFAQNILEIQIALILLAVWMLGTLALHRLARSIPAIRRATPDWVSWNRRLHVPVGVALAGTLATYLALKAFPSFYSLLAGAVGFTST